MSETVENVNENRSFTFPWPIYIPGVTLGIILAALGVILALAVGVPPFGRLIGFLLFLAGVIAFAL